MYLFSVPLNQQSRAQLLLRHGEAVVVVVVVVDVVVVVAWHGVDAVSQDSVPSLAGCKQSQSGQFLVT